MRLEGKVAIVTGATAGMGRAAAELFAQEGAKVVLCGRREPLGQEIVEVIKGRGGDATFVTADVAKAEDVKKSRGHGGQQLRQAGRAVQQRRHRLLRLRPSR